MFKQTSSMDEIYRSMEKKLVKVQNEEKFGPNTKILKAAVFLDTAADIFDQVGMHEESTDITNILLDLSKDLK